MTCVENAPKYVVKKYKIAYNVYFLAVSNNSNKQNLTKKKSVGGQCFNSWQQESGMYNMKTMTRPGFSCHTLSQTRKGWWTSQPVLCQTLLLVCTPIPWDNWKIIEVFSFIFSCFPKSIFENKRITKILSKYIKHKKKQMWHNKWKELRFS